MDYGHIGTQTFPCTSVLFFYVSGYSSIEQRQHRETQSPEQTLTVDILRLYVLESKKTRENAKKSNSSDRDDDKKLDEGLE